MRNKFKKSFKLILKLSEPKLCISITKLTTKSTSDYSIYSSHYMLIMSLLKYNQHLITFSLGFFFFFFFAIINMSKQTHSYGSQSNCNVFNQGSRAQLNQTLIWIMVTQTRLKHQHLKSVWLVMCEAGDAVYGVV